MGSASGGTYIPLDFGGAKACPAALAARAPAAERKEQEPAHGLLEQRKEAGEPAADAFEQPVNATEASSAAAATCYARATHALEDAAGTLDSAVAAKCCLP